MKTKSKKFEKKVVISHCETCGDPNHNPTGKEGETGTNSGKFDWDSVVTTGLNSISDIVTSIWGKQPTYNTYNNNNNDNKSNTGLYVSLGAGALVLIVLLVVLLKK